MTEIEKAIDVVRQLVGELRIERNNLKHECKCLQRELDLTKWQLKNLQEKMNLQPAYSPSANKNEESKELTPEEAWRVIRHLTSRSYISGDEFEAMGIVAKVIDRTGKWAQEIYLEWRKNDSCLCHKFLDTIFDWKEDQ